jgi:hypothetical protein
MSRQIVIWFIVSLIRILCFSTVNAQSVIEGYVLDKANQAPLVGANVFAIDSSYGTITNIEGYFALQIKKQTESIIIKYLGYQDTIVSINSFLNSSSSEIFLSPVSNLAKEVEIHQQKSDRNLTKHSGEYLLTREELLSIPSFMGQLDPVKALQYTTGVALSNEGDAGIYVRGGGPGQNLILLEEIPIYNPSHLLGLYSTFTDYSLSSAKLYKASPPADLGGRISSEYDISMKNSARDALQGQASIGLLSSEIGISGQTPGNEVFYLFSGRLSYFNFMKEQMLDPVFSNSGSFFKNTQYNFTDLNFKIRFKTGKKQYMSLTGYNGQDLYAFKNPNFQFNNELNWGNTAVGINHSYYFTDHLKLYSQGAFSSYDFLLSAKNPGAEISLKNQITDYQWKEKIVYERNSHKITGGFEYIFHHLVPNEYRVKSEGLGLGGSLNFYTHDLVFFMEDSWKVSERIKLRTGIRLPVYLQTGPHEDIIYNEAGIAADTLFSKKGKIISHYVIPEPRINLIYQLLSSSSLRFSYCRLSQNIHLIPIGSISLPTDFWLPGTSYIEPEKAHQISLGYSKNMNSNTYESGIEAYYRHMTNQLELDHGIFSNPSERNIKNNLIKGQAQSVGVEFNISKKKGAYRGEINYTLSKSWRRFHEIQPGPFPAKYDRTHDLNILQKYSLSDKWSFASVFVYATGNMMSLPTGRYLIQGNIVNDYGGKNNFRLPPYHRLDISATRKITTEKLKGELILTIYNAYNRKNPFYYVYFVEGDLENLYLKVDSYQVHLFPILPTLSFKLFF